MPYFIAEMSANHNGSLKTALKICEAAKEAGADALKLQTYTPAGMTMDKDLLNLYKRAYLRQKWHEPIFKKCKELDLTCFSTPFEQKDVDFLEELDCPMYKVASFEIIDIPLIEYIAQTGKPIIISTGMATTMEIEDALRAAEGCKVTLLKCTSAYPAKVEDANLLTIPDLKRRYKVRIGISDHTKGIGVAIAAVALGAEVVEKHFTIEDKGIDADCSLHPEEFAQMVRECKGVAKSLGTVHYGPTANEWQRYRRSLWIVKDIEKGETFTEEHVRSLRPVGGIPPKHYPGVVGAKCKRTLKKGEPLTWDAV